MSWVVCALEGLAATVGELRESGTIGSGVAAVGEAITDVGSAMDALFVQMRTLRPVSSPAVTLSPAG